MYILPQNISSVEGGRAELCLLSTDVFQMSGATEEMLSKYLLHEDMHIRSMKPNLTYFCS